MSENPTAKKATLPPALYANFLRVSEDRAQFFLAFGQVAQDASGTAHLLGSFATTPSHAKAMLHTLAAAVTRYEARYGEIPEPEAPARPVGAGEAPPRQASRGLVK